MHENSLPAKEIFWRLEIAKLKCKMFDFEQNHKNIFREIIPLYGIGKPGYTVAAVYHEKLS